MIEQTAHNTVFAVRANALTQILGFASHFAYTDTVIRNGLKGESNMEMKDVLLVLFPIMAGIISSYLTYYFTIKSKKSEAILKFKEEKYANLLVLLQGFVGTTASGDTKRKFLKNNTGHGYIAQIM